MAMVRNSRIVVNAFTTELSMLKVMLVMLILLLLLMLLLLTISMNMAISVNMLMDAVGMVLMLNIEQLPLCGVDDDDVDGVSTQVTASHKFWT